MGFELRRFGFVAVTALLAFKAALVFQQLALYLAMRGLGCANTTFDLGFGLGGTEARGIESCTSAAATAAAAVGVFAGLLVAIPILLLYVTGRTPARRFPAAFVYLFALGAVAEMLSGAVVFALLGRYEAQVLIANGVPLLALVGVGLVAGALLLLPIRATTPFFAVDLLDHPESHVTLFKKAVLFKLTAGVGIISLVRVIA